MIKINKSWNWSEVCSVRLVKDSIVFFGKRKIIIFSPIGDAEQFNILKIWK